VDYYFNWPDYYSFGWITISFGLITTSFG
jgi:hypothetical protein